MADEPKTLTPLQITLTVIYLLIYPVILFLLAGDWVWPEGWIFTVWFIGLCTVTLIYLYIKDPALLAERFRRPGTGGEKGWDKYFVYAIAGMFMVWYAIMPVDARRFHWTPEFPLWLKIAGGVMLVFASFFFFRAFSDNTFASPLVRIQTERRHQVVSTGVYGLVRHPMYLGATLLFFGTAVLLGSLYGIAAAGLLTIILIVRIFGEEKMLVDELEGYADYRKKVRYRLIPFIW